MPTCCARLASRPIDNSLSLLGTWLVKVSRRLRSVMPEIFEMRFLDRVDYLLEGSVELFVKVDLDEISSAYRRY